MRAIRSVLAPLLGVLVIAGEVPAVHADTIVVYGASGKIGGVIVSEALSRGHTVIGVSRNAAKLKVDNKKFKAVTGDVTDFDSFKKLTQGADAVIISVSGGGDDKDPKNTTTAKAARVAVQAFSGASKSPEVIQIGGATTMAGTREAMEASMPPFAKPGTPVYTMMFGHLEALQTYQASKIRWSVLTPPMDIAGMGMGDKPIVLNRTGKYRTSTTAAVKDANGKSSVNIADLAVAAVDEAEKHQFLGQRFTVGY